jgi:adenylate cyclase
MPELGKDDGERKQVTVLFADVSGSMDLAEGQDPEEWRKIMQRFFAILAAAVERFEGTVDKFTGDGIMAVFGAPVAHEDHARRACYAALQMLDDVAEYAAELRRGPGLNFSTRIGVNSGEVVAGAIGAGEEGSYTAIGHTVGLRLPDRANRRPGGRLPRAQRPGRVRHQGLEPAGRGVRADRCRRSPLAAGPLA